MKLFTKISAWCLIGLQISSIALAYHTPHTKTTVTNPLSGVEVRITESISDGEFFRYQVVECDLNNPNLQLDILYPQEGASTLKSSRNIGTDNGAAVVMNADYFNRSSEASKGSAVGYNAKDGKMLSNALEEKVYSFSYSDDHQYSFDVFSNQIKLGFRDEVFEFVKTYNKYSPLDGIAIFDQHWGKESLGSEGTLVELVVENGILTEIRRDMPPVAIPENGFVVAGLSDLTTLFEQIQVGDKVTLEVITTPTLEFLPDFTIGGGSLLVDKGELVQEMSYPISGTTAFPALGISKDGKTLWMITVVNQSGITQKKMAELCLKEGAYYAINLDGGGSTQCAVIDNTSGELKYIHELSGGYERPVANAIGIIAEAEEKKPYGIKATDAICYSNVPKQLTATVYDQTGMPMEVDSKQIKFSLKEGNGTIKNGYFYGEALSTATILMEYQGAVGTFTLTTVAPATYAEKTKNETYRVTNPDGYTREISKEEYDKATGIILKDSLPKNDVMTENLGLSNSLSIYGGSRSYDTFFTRLLTSTVLEKINPSIYPFTDKNIENDKIEIVTIDNAKNRILNKGMEEWNRLEEALNTEKQNIILVMTQPLSFSRPQEEKLFFEAISKTRMEGKNILVIHRGEKTELVTLKDGVRVISVAFDTASVTSFLKQPTEYLKIHYNDSQMTYEIVSNSLFQVN
ncbi:MAG: phosphodiester glycosidase family protein [Clostridia bacterium]|nr:phosphodiester glycosidase family protein [Clostridia bacterium]